MAEEEPVSLQPGDLVKVKADEKLAFVRLCKEHERMEGLVVDEFLDFVEEICELQGKRPRDMKRFLKSVKAGSVIVSHVGGVELISFLPSELELVDRPLAHGAIVSQSADGDQQYAVVEKVRITLTVRHLQDGYQHGEPFDIDAEVLKPVVPIDEGDVVLGGERIGIVESCAQVLIRKFPNGATARTWPDGCELSSRTNEAYYYSGEKIFYPGQAIKLRSCHQSVINPEHMDLEWTHRSSRSSLATVRKLDVKHINVRWIAQRPSTDAEDSMMSGVNNFWGPMTEVVPLSQLRLFDPFQPLDWRCGEIGLLRDASVSVAADGSQQASPERKRDRPAGESGSTAGNVQPAVQSTKQGGRWEYLLDTMYNLNNKEAEVERDTKATAAEDETPMEVDDDHTSGDSECGSSDEGVEEEEESVDEGRQYGGGRLARLHRLRRERMTAQTSSAVASQDTSEPPATVQIISTRTEVDLYWQDGTRVCNKLATAYVTVEHIDAYDFFPGEYIGGSEGRSGAVLKVDHKDRMVDVLWNAEGLDREPVSETLSVYELKKSFENDIQPRDIVMRVDEAAERRETEAWVGHVAKLDRGKLEVVWNDGTVGTISPEKIIDIHSGKDHSHTSESVHTSDGMDDLADGDHWDFSIDEEGSDSDRGSTDTDAEMRSHSADSAIRPSSESRQEASSDCGYLPRSESPPLADSVTASIAEDGSKLDENAVVNENGKEYTEEGGPVEEKAGSTKFPTFEVLETAPLEHRLDDGSTNYQASLATTVRKEWRRLSTGLPDGIFVRVFESRLDLIRAAIVGPRDTPYEDCIYLFDMRLPRNYPDAPPQVYFFSNGLRINPNLYENGKVCLSILGTWDGDKVEQWNPKSSNVLRVLLSLQAIVLSEEPYYNEAGYDAQIGSAEGKNKSKLYNESALLLTMRHALETRQLTRYPPEFRDLLQEHYLTHADAIIARCERLMSSPDYSAGFKKSLESVIPRLSELKHL